MPGLALRAALVAAKALSFAYFLGVVRIESSSVAEAAAQSAPWARAAVWPGVWGAHDNFHVQVLRERQLNTSRIKHARRIRLLLEYKPSAWYVACFNGRI